MSETRLGRLRHFQFDDPIGVALSLYGEWAQLELNFLKELIREGDMVVDIGANVGTHTLAFAQATGPTGTVHAFEPQPQVMRLLVENVEQNQVKNVVFHEAAVSNASGTLPMTVPDMTRRHNSGAASLERAEGSTAAQIEVRTMRLDELELPRCDLLKIDIEGWEEKCLEGAKGLLERTRPLIYAECNSIEKGWRLISMLGAEWLCFLHTAPAFNPDNFKEKSENVFGLAEETNLLFVHRSQKERVSAVLAHEHRLVELKSLDQLATAYVRAARYGDATVDPARAALLSRRVVLLEREVAAAHASQLAAAPRAPSAPSTAPKKLTKPVLVVVPIYNGLVDFERLVQSLFYSHPTPDPLLKFAFVNDASPDPAVAAFLKDDVFKRPDVTLLENQKNRGFIGTVNRGFELNVFDDALTDIIILNTDTLVFGNAFAIMQDVALRLPNVASVTPLTNNGTIASLFSWPHGAGLFSMLEPEMVARAVEAAAVVSPLVDLPTGVGFCMYMTRAALDEVGAFDTAFGKGYGEENRWCQLASQAGYVNVMTTEAFVYHHGSQSFGSETKRLQLESNMQLLNKLHPTYHSDVMSHLDADPLRDARANVLWAVRRSAKVSFNLHTVLYLLHSDPAYFAGGTERHVMALTDELLNEGRTEVFHLFPDQRSGQWQLRCYFPRGVKDATNPEMLVARYDAESVLALLEAIAPDVDTLHVHHALGWPRWLTQVPALFSHSKKLLTLHDYFAICPSIRLIRNGAYCGVPADMGECNRCLREVIGVKGISMESYRSISAKLIAQFDEVFAPSPAAVEVLQKGFSRVLAPKFGTLANITVRRIHALPNFLFDTPVEGRPSLEPRIAAARPRVIFLGAWCEPKGSKLFSEITPDMLRRGWQVEVWGTLGWEMPAGVIHRTYKTSAELRALAIEYPVDAVAVPAIWPETFSFTTFEAALDVGAPVVVGPFGNPPDLVRAHGIGLVVPHLTGQELLRAIEELIADRLKFSSKLEALAEKATTLSIDTYLNAAYRHRASTQPVGALRRLPMPATHRRPIEETTRVVYQQTQDDPPLRHVLVDQTNELIKSATPFLHRYGKRFGSWISARRRAQ